ncbi:unnamed protein product [Rangifer tarandus platyrhynchus]|uniref:Uncharacterized protein n=1 Tax=Rangifer tarandus platyrhynchus TaxID=3082113 RepID=A0AC60A1X6_RANTA
MDCGPPDSFVHGIFQARIPEWVAISYSRGSSQTQGLNPHLLSLLHWQVLFHTRPPWEALMFVAVAGFDLRTAFIIIYLMARLWIRASCSEHGVTSISLLRSAGPGSHP